MSPRKNDKEIIAIELLYHVKFYISYYAQKCVAIGLIFFSLPHLNSQSYAYYSHSQSINMNPNLSFKITVVDNPSKRRKTVHFMLSQLQTIHLLNLQCNVLSTRGPSAIAGSLDFSKPLSSEIYHISGKSRTVQFISTRECSRISG